MQRRGGGVIVIIASIFGREAGGRMTYNAVKAAEISLAKSLAQQLAPLNIRVNSVSPGSILFEGGSWWKRQQEDPRASPSSWRASSRSADSAGRRRSPTSSPSWRHRARAGSAAGTTANWNIQAHSAEKDVPAGLGIVEGDEIPYQPWAAAKKRENFANRATADPDARCFLPGVPRATYLPFPFQIFQTPNHIAIAYEYVHAVRRIFMNSPHPRGPLEFWMGDSRGHWEGDTLVVDVVYFTNQTWFDRAGNFHSEALHVVERYTPITRTTSTMRRPSKIRRCSHGRGR